MSVLIIDGVDYSDVTVASVSRKATVKDSKLSGEMFDGSYHRDILGTYIDYDMKIVCKVTERGKYTEIYELLTAPVASHEVTVPYNDTTMTFRAYIQTVGDDLFHYDEQGALWRNLSCTFKAVSPQKAVV